MRVKEVQEKTKMSKQTILFYEKEGLLKPSRDENGYRNYNEKDLETLKLIKMLREMDISLDEIKMVLSGKMSFGDCLSEKEKYMQQKITELQSVYDKVNELKEKEIPIIPELNEVEVKPRKKTWGFQRGSNKVSIGRRLSQKHLRRQAKRNAASVLMLTGCCMIGYYNMYDQIPSVNIVIIIFLFFSIFSLFIYTNNPVSGYYMHPTSDFFIELDETGLTVFQPKNIFEYYKNVYNVMLFNKYNFEYHYLYEDISLLKLSSHRRKGAITLPPFTLSGYTVDFVLEFNDGRHIFLDNPITLDDDLKFFAIILKNKCKNIDDKENILNSFEKEIHIDEHMQKILEEKYLKKH